MSFLYRIHRYIFGDPPPFSSFDAEQMLNYINSNINNNYNDNDYIMLIKYLCENDNHKKYNYNTPKDAINDINMKLNQHPKLYMGEYERYLMYNLYQYLDDDVLLKYLYNCEYLEHNLRGIKFTKHLLKMMEEREYIRDRVAIVMDILPNIILPNISNKYNIDFRFTFEDEFVFNTITCYMSKSINAQEFSELTKMNHISLKYKKYDFINNEKMVESIYKI